jgi:hypothetical protein
MGIHPRELQEIGKIFAISDLLDVRYAAAGAPSVRIAGLFALMNLCKSPSDE